MQSPEININEFDYDLPTGRIAKYPLEQRDISKLLVYQKGEISELPFYKLPSVLPEGMALVFNNSRVISARLLFKKDTGALIEIFCLEPIDPPEYQQNLTNTRCVRWKCLIGNKKRWKSGPLTASIPIGETTCKISALCISNHNEHAIVEFSWDKGFSFGEILDHAGKIPIPPYLQRDSEDIDKTRYQTVYSRVKGSVAAPTAGLHFTPRIFEELELNNLPFCELTLHVGAGTFKPVQAADIGDHVMHEEFFSFSSKNLEFLLTHCENMVAVGTTSARMLESIYYMGLKCLGNETDFTKIGQWEWLNLKPEVSCQLALTALLNHMNENRLEVLTAHTSIMILPGYRFRMIKGLVTNFHQPRSTLLLLIAALTGENWKEIYRYALDNDFRFLSYGDSSVLLP